MVRYIEGKGTTRKWCFDWRNILRRRSSMRLHQPSIGTGMHHQLPCEGERGKADNTVNHLFTRSAPAVARDKPQQSDTRLRGKKLILARTACLVAGILSFGVFVASVPATYEALLSLSCAQDLCALIQHKPQSGLFSNSRLWASLFKPMP